MPGNKLKSGSVKHPGLQCPASSCLYTGILTHARFKPKAHAFRYPVYYFCLDLDEIEHISRHWLFGHNRFRPLAFYDKDYLGQPGLSVKENLLNFLRNQKVELPQGKIFLLTQVRVLGYVFNPVNYFYCFDRKGSLELVVAEVHNTFGEYYVYNFPRNKAFAVGPGLGFRVDKKMHVSPFVSMDAQYQFEFRKLGAHLEVQVKMWENGQAFFNARLSGKPRPIYFGSLLWCLLAYPFMTLQIIFFIHWQAFLLWLKKVPFYRKPSPAPGVFRWRE